LDSKGQDVEFKKWGHLRIPYRPPENGEFSKILVPTEETAKYQYLSRLHVERGHSFCIIGESGVSKTVVLKSFLQTLDIEENFVLNLNFSSSTKSIDMYNWLMECLEKDIGKNMKPKQNKVLVCYIDDMSMPQKDPYNTQQVIAFMKFLFEFK
jgi:dynein heavy chain